MAGIKYEFTTEERDCIVVALELLIEANGDEAFPRHDPRSLIKWVRSRGPQKGGMK